MGEWSHPEITLDELLKLIKGFVDILILASGYQSSGRFAHWDPLNIKKAFQWGIFFENVFESIDFNEDSIDELDTALSKLTSDPHFPQGLTHISSTTLGKARLFILEHFIRTLPMRDEHLKSILKATIEMDLDELQRTKTDYLDMYLDKLMLQKSQVSVEEGKMDISPGSSPHAKNFTKTDLTTFAIEGITKRQVAVSCVSSMETCVDVLAKIITQKTSNDEVLDDLLQEQKNVCVWNNWRTKTLSYLLDKKTIRLVSGASMIFSAPKFQWVQVLEQLDTSNEELEIFELLLVGCISRRWNRVIQIYTSSSYEPFSIYTLYEGVHNLIMKRFENIKFMEETKDSKEQEIIEYLDVKLSNQIHRLWELSPVLIAVSLPPWSRLFEAYASELLSQFKGKTTNFRCCSCSDDNKEHIECEVAERIWCLYIFHVSKFQC